MIRPNIPLEGIAPGGPGARVARSAAACSARQGLALLALLLGASLVGLLALYDPSFISIDGAFFVSAAKNLASGHGFATSIVWHEEQYRFGGIPAPQTVFPPGYPLLIALASGLGLDRPYAAFLISLLSFCAIALVLYDTLRTTGHPPRSSLAVSAVWLGLPFAWFNVLGCLSELPFTLLTLLSLRCIVQSERDPERRDLWLAAAGTVAGLAFTVRYQGLYYLTGLGLFFLLRSLWRRDWPAVRALLLVSGPPSVFVAALFLRNYRLTGKTGTLMPGEQSLPEVLRTVWWALGGLLGFTKSGLLGGGVPEAALVILAVVGLLGVACGVGRLRIDRSALQTALAETPVGLALAYMAVTIVLMVQGAQHYASGHISPRYLLALIPFGLLCLPAGLRSVRFTPIRAWQAPAARLWWGAALVVLVAGQVNVFHRHWHSLTHANPYHTMREALQRPLAGEPLIHFLQQRVTTASPLVGNEPQLLGAVLDRPVLGLTQGAYTRRVWTEDQVRRLVASYGVAYVVFFPDLFDPTNPGDRNGVFFHQLKGGHVPPWLVPVLVGPDVRLYRVEGAVDGGWPGEPAPGGGRT